MSDPTTVYSSRLYGWWAEQTDTTAGVFTWTNEVISSDFGAGPSLIADNITWGDLPTVGTTPAGKKDLEWNGPGTNFGVGHYPVVTSSPTAWQVAIAVYVPEVIGDYSYSRVLDIPIGVYIGGVLSSPDDGSYVVRVIAQYEGPGFGDTGYTANIVGNFSLGIGEALISGTLISGAWNIIVVDHTIGGDAHLYINGSLADTTSTWGDTTDGYGGPATATSTSVQITSTVGGYTADWRTCSPVVAYDTSAFTSTDASNIYDVLYAYVTDSTIHCTLNTGLGDILCSGLIASVGNGVLNKQLGNITLSSAAIAPAAASLSQQLGDINLTASNTTVNICNLTAQLGSITCSSTTKALATGQLTKTLGSITCISATKAIANVSLDQQLGDIATTVPRVCSLSKQLGSMSVVSHSFAYYKYTFPKQKGNSDPFAVLGEYDLSIE